jgi:UDP-N-acetylglucosamine:LPS N-acetylglucosamine transferase
MGRHAGKLSRVKRARLLAIASGGGHWVQLQRLCPAFEGFEVTFVSTFDHYVTQVDGHRFYVVPNASRFELKGFLPGMWRALKILCRERPDAIVTTGSAPMLAFLLLGRMIGAKTLWVDSLANPERMSSSGRLARKIAHQTVSQWPEVADAEHVGYWGSVL